MWGASAPAVSTPVAAVSQASKNPHSSASSMFPFSAAVAINGYSPRESSGLQTPYWPQPRGVSADQAVSSILPSSFKVGDAVEIWSNSQQSWCRGIVDRAEGDLVSILYTALDGHQICKVMRNNDKDVRLVEREKLPKHRSSSSGSGPQTSGRKHHAKPLGSVDFEEAMRFLEVLRRHEDNRECADCGAANPDWASMQDGTVVCLDCAGVHRCLGKTLKSLARPEIWKASDAATFCAMGGNMKANRCLAEKAGLTAPRPPPDTDRNFVERYIVRKYGGTTFFDSYQCQESSRALVRELAEEVERKRLEKEKAEKEARAAAERERREREARERAAQEAKQAAERARLEQAAERARRESEMLKQAEREAHERAVAANGPLPGGFRDATPAAAAIPACPSHMMIGHDPASSLSGLVVADVVSVNLFRERVRDLRYLGAWLLNLSVVVSLGKVSAVPTAPRRSSASVRWEPPEQRELRWDCKQRWLWCRVNDNLAGGSTQLAGVGVVDVRAAEAEAATNGVKAAEMELELLAKEPASQAQLSDLLFFTACQARPAIMGDDDDEEDHPASRKANAACWRIPAGVHGPPGPPGAHGHYMFEQVEDIDHLMHGQTCGTAIVRLTVLDPTSVKAGMPQGYVV